jgi:hypothetical protein
LAAPEVLAPPIRRAMPLAAHVAGLALALLTLFPLLGGDGLFSADEGAAAAQTRLLSRSEGWAAHHPVPALDPEGEAFPLEYATPVPGTSGAAPFAKHPAYPVLLTVLDRGFGLGGMVLASVVGTVAAAAVAGLLARRVVPELAALAVWATGLATPLFFDSWLVIAHTLGAALVGAAVLSVVRAHEGRGGPALLAVAAASTGAVLVRNEAVLFAVALALAAAWVGVRARSRPVVVAGLAALAGAALGYVVDGLLSAAVAGDAEAGFAAGVGHGGFVSGRLAEAVVTLLLPSYGRLGLPDALLVLTAGALVGAVVIARRRPEDVDGIRLFAGIAVVAAVARAVVAPEVVPGLLVAAPVLTAGLAALSRRTFTALAARLAGLTVVLFVGAVLATQYASGGSGEWGGRYFALALPVAVPVVLLGLRQVAEGLAPVARRTLGGALVVVALASAVLAGRSLVATEDRSERLVDVVDEVAAGVDDPVRIATAGAPARFAWDQVLEGTDWLLVAPEDLRAWLDRAGEQGRDVVLVTPDPDRDRPATEGWTPVLEREVGGGSTWVAAGYEMS